MTKSGAGRLDRVLGQPCPYCGNKMGRTHPRRGDAPTRDHVWPQSLGGRLTVICCRKCNGDKGHLSLDEWAVVLIMRNDFRRGTVSRLAADLKNGVVVVLAHEISGSVRGLSVGLGYGVFA